MQANLLKKQIFFKNNLEYIYLVERFLNYRYFIFNRYEDLEIYYSLVLKVKYIYISLTKLFIAIYSALNSLYLYFL